MIKLAHYLTCVLLLVLLVYPYAFAIKSPLAEGPFSKMEMDLRKSIFGIHVMSVEVRVDTSTKERIASIVRGSHNFESNAPEVARAIYAADHVTVKLHFMRGVGFSRFIDELKNGERCVYEEHLIGRTEFARVEGGAEQWYSSIRDRGIRDGDEMIYDIDGPSVHTTLISQKGRVFLDQVDVGQEKALSVLGGYFASCSEFREPLVRSLYSYP